MLKFRTYLKESSIQGSNFKKLEKMMADSLKKSPFSSFKEIEEWYKERKLPMNSARLSVYNNIDRKVRNDFEKEIGASEKDIDAALIKITGIK